MGEENHNVLRFFHILPNLHDLHELLDYFYSYFTIVDAYSLQYDVCSESHSSNIRIVTHLVSKIEEFKESSTKIVKQLK